MVRVYQGRPTSRVPRPRSGSSGFGPEIVSLTLSAPAEAAGAAKEYRNCTALNGAYPHGVGKVGAHDKTSGRPVTNFKRSNALYKATKKSDRDGDKIACEKH